MTMTNNLTVKVKQVLTKVLRHSISEVRSELKSIKDQNDAIKMLLGRMMAREYKGKLFDHLHESEFKVFSQWGEDGIIQYLISRIGVQERRFIEFGVENYLESNTRFLLQNDNWEGLVIDGSETNVNYIRRDVVYWRHSLTAICAFINVENINKIISDAGFSGDIGLLSIDIDGNDYWVWKAIDVVRPVIAVLEYNSLFGCERPITIPYDPHFYRMNAHHSGLYFGASLPALCLLAKEKGYAFVGSNSAGNNAFFIKRTHLGGMEELTARQGFIESRFREHRDCNGRLTYTAGKEAIESIRGMPIYNIVKNDLEVL